MRYLLLAAVLLGAALPVSAQVGTVQGRVTDASTGETLPGVNVVLEGTSLGTATGVDGRFTFTAPPGNYNLLTTFVGYRRTTRPIIVQANQTVNVEIELEEDLLGLEEVFVVGYGTTSELARTGSVARVGERELEDAVVNSFEQVLQGRAAGVTVQTNNGKLGQGIQVRVRGAASVTAGNDPLYVIDGIPVTTDNTSTNDARTNPLAQLNPGDIASIEVLKDASASAIYGARASNGVVLITTKSGFNGRTQFSVDVRRSSSTPTRKVDLLNAQEYVELLLEAAENSARLDPGYDYVGDVEGLFDFLADGTDWRSQEVDTDWQDEAFQNGTGLNLDVSARGGNQQTQFYVSGSYSEEDGILIRDSYDRMSGRLNLNHDLSSVFSLGANLSLSRAVNNRLSTDNGFATPVQLIAQAPISRAYDPVTGEANPNTLYFNGLLYVDNTRFVVTAYRNVGNIYGDLKLAPNLRFRSEFGVDVLDDNSDEYYNSRVGDNTGAQQGLGLSTWNRIVNYTTNNYLTYARRYSTDHNVETVAGMSFQDVNSQFTQVQGEEFPNDDFQQIANAARITGGTAGRSAYRFLGYFGRANYDFKSRYFLSLSGRIDGSSRFGANNRYGFFPAASAAWVLSEEPFLQGLPGVSFLKARLSYGVTGNAAIGNFASLGLFGAGSFNGRPGLIPTQVPNPDLAWERTTQVNFGLDFGLFSDRFSGELDFYTKDTDDLLLNVNVPGTTGFSSILRNVGRLENRGVELNLTGRIIDGRDLTWTTGFNLAANRNEIKDLNEQVITGGFINQAIEGQPIGVFFGYEYAGVDPDNGDALYFVNEEDENGNIIDPQATTNNPNEANRVVLGSPHPDFTGGFNNTLAYRGFEVQMFWQFVTGNKIFDGGGRFKSANGDYYDNQSRDQLDRWRQPGDRTDVPEARLYFGNGTANSSRYLYDGSYLRLKNLTFAYNVPTRLLDRFSVQSARIYVIGTNLLTFTEYPWWDPEVNADYVAGNIGLGNEFYSAPQARTITTGIQFTF